MIHCDSKIENKTSQRKKSHDEAHYIGSHRNAVCSSQQVDIIVADGKVMVDGGPVVTTDIGTSNGVIHVIDSVILP